MAGELKKILPNVYYDDQWVSFVDKEDILSVARSLKKIGFDYLLDLCVVDYLTYGVSEWDVTSTEGYSRASVASESTWEGARFVVVCHLLSTSSKLRVRLKINMDESLSMPSLISIWPSARWYEREAYDLFGIGFLNHSKLTRILTDYGFEGHPFRKDFPLEGYVEMRYDGEMGGCIYEPVSIENRVGVPKVVREDNRYHHDE